MRVLAAYKSWSGDIGQQKWQNIKHNMITEHDIVLDMGLGVASRLTLLGLRIQWVPAVALVVSGVSCDWG